MVDHAQFEYQIDATIIIRTKRMQYMCKEHQILYVENIGKKLHIHTNSKQPIEVYGSMRDMEILVGPKFFRCHRGFLVNMEHIHGYSKNTIVMDNGDEIFLARDRYPAFVAAYDKFL
ncbi:MAG: LytTR family transcriptional regulator DNA-binding domain-containing protein [Lachnospiraceae bacterium]|nr:LytTR family transcriptional regulator DNA-binding domain-containing protein [Lachnospiraceae bacterium]